jgi:IS30 family transposase
MAMEKGTGPGRRLTKDQQGEIRRRIHDGEQYRAVAATMGHSTRTIQQVVGRQGGVGPRTRARAKLRLSHCEREEISRGLQAEASLRQIAAELGRAPSTVSREVGANGGRRGYRAWQADRRAERRLCRPKVAKLARGAHLRQEVEEGLAQHWSPQQIARRLRLDYPDKAEMRVSHETIYQSLYVQGRGALRRELSRYLRRGRAKRRPRKRGPGGPGQLREMVSISARPPEVADRAVPGHWEGDLLLGKTGLSAIGTLVERQTRFVMLFPLPHGRHAEAVREQLAAKILELPENLRRSLTWDQGKEMAEHKRFTIDTGVQIYFCDPHSPWQRGANENTNGLLRQYFPKGTVLSAFTATELDAVAAELNGRPRQTLGWLKPSEAFARVLQ